MFLKSYKVKSNTPLKGSDVKRFRQLLEKSFPHATAEQLQILLPSKSGVSVLKLITHGNVQTQVYCVDKLPLFFELEGGSLAPTLYALWRVPDLVPYFTTHPAVLPKLSNGADLMLPGVIPQGTGLGMYGHYKRDQLVGVNLTNNKAAVGIGLLARSSDDLYMSGGHGSAVKMVHIFGDKLWGHEPSLVQQIPNHNVKNLCQDDFPALGDDRKKKKVTEENEAKEPTTADVVAQINELELQEKISDPSLSSQSDSEAVLDGLTSQEAFDIPFINEDQVEEITPEEILKRAFLSALKNHGKSLELPLLTSNFYRLYVVPEAAQPLDIKKTKYKKLSNFLAEMVNQGFIVMREETKGVDKITDIDLDHPELVNFIVDFKPHTAGTSNGEQQDGQDQPLFHSELVELYTVSDATAPFFTKVNYKRGEGIPATQIKKVIREYVNKLNLRIVNPETKSYELDDVLSQLCHSQQASLSQIIAAVIGQMQHTYQMCSVKDVSANKPAIQMSLATRSGNKKVTLVSNIEAYGIIMSEFIKLCKQGAAASTTTVKLPHQKNEQLQIQGNQVRFVYNLLTETYKVPAKCIKGLELAKDGKKNKKK